MLAAFALGTACKLACPTASFCPGCSQKQLHLLAVDCVAAFTVRALCMQIGISDDTHQE